MPTSSSENGKGSRRRDSSITDSMFKANWLAIFAKRKKQKKNKEKTRLRSKK